MEKPKFIQPVIHMEVHIKATESKIPLSILLQTENLELLWVLITVLSGILPFCTGWNFTVFRVA